MHMPLKWPVGPGEFNFFSTNKGEGERACPLLVYYYTSVGLVLIFNECAPVAM